VAPVRADLARLLPSGRSLVVGFAIVAAVGAAYWIARATPIFAIQRIQVEGAPPTVRAEIEQTLRSERGTSLLAVSGEDAVRRVEALPGVISATSDRSFPRTLRIVVSPERPVAVLRRGPDSWLVSARGRVLMRLSRRVRRGLPRVWVQSGASVAVGEVLSDGSGGVAARSVALLQAAGLGGVRGAVLSKTSGLVFVLRSGVELRLGPPVDVALKLAIAGRIVPLLLPGTPALDLAVPERPVSEPNPQPGG
jgi:hypothetical protein